MMINEPQGDDIFCTVAAYSHVSSQTSFCPTYLSPCCFWLLGFWWFFNLNRHYRGHVGVTLHNFFLQASQQAKAMIGIHHTKWRQSDGWLDALPLVEVAVSDSSPASLSDLLWEASRSQTHRPAMDNANQSLTVSRRGTFKSSKTKPTSQIFAFAPCLSPS